MERIFALYDSDVYYATRFMEYFKNKNDLGFDFIVFTCKDSLEEFLTGHSIELILLGEDVTLEGIDTGRIKCICQFTDQAGTISAGGYPGIQKFQSAQGVLSDSMAIYQRQVNASGQPYKARQMKLTSVFSPVPNAESLLFTWSAASLLSRRNKVLLVLLESYPVQILSTTACAQQSLTEFIYYLKEDPDIIAKMESLLGCQGNLSWLAGVGNGMDILSLTKEDVGKWVGELLSRTDYQQIVFYIGSWSEAAAEFMKLSNSVLMIEKDELYDRTVMKVFTEQLGKTGVDSSENKIHKLKLLREENIRQLPMTPEELAETASWYLAEQNVNLFL